jgi:hypothetical protein
MPFFGDLMFAFGEWLKTTALVPFALWLNTTPASKLVDSNIWIAPVVQTIHILAIATTFMAVQMICLRILQFAGRGQTMQRTVARYVPWVWWGLLTLLATGVILIIGEPPRELINPAFWTKMILIVVAVAVALAFEASVRRNADRWEASPGGTLAVRAGAAGVIALWCFIIFFGRWIAYVAI